METLQIYLIAAIAAAAFFALLSFFLLMRVRSRDSQSALPAELMSRMDRIDTIAREMETLTRAFLVPRTRGGMGELLLEDLLKAWLPPGQGNRRAEQKPGRRAAENLLRLCG